MIERAEDKSWKSPLRKLDEWEDELLRRYPESQVPAGAAMDSSLLPDAATDSACLLYTSPSPRD